MLHIVQCNINMGGKQLFPAAIKMRFVHPKGILQGLMDHLADASEFSVLCLFNLWWRFSVRLARNTVGMVA